MVHLFFALEKTCFRKVFDYQLASLFRLESAVFFRNVFVELSVWSKKVDYFKVVSLSYFPVVRVVGWSNLYHTCSEFLVYIVVGNDWNFFSCDRKFEFLSDKGSVAFVRRVYCDCCITKESFRTSCCNFNLSASVCVFVVKVVHCTLCVFMVNFIISKGSTTARTPVYKALSLVHKAAFIKCYENIADCL